MLNMPYEVRGFGSSTAQYKAIQDSSFDPARAGFLASGHLGSTRMFETANLAANSLAATEQKNRIFISMTDGRLNDEYETAIALKQARRQGIVTFGIFFGDPSGNTAALDELYDKNWVAINNLKDLPAVVGKKLEIMFRRMR